MERASDASGPAGSGKDRDRVYIDHGGSTRPFMRGILVHSLMARGVAFEDAYRVANAVRDQLRGQGVVPREALSAAIESALRAHNLAADASRSLAPTIWIRSHGHATPFSKGFLSQSLLAAAIDPNDAFDVAREIEAALIRQGAAEIERHALRRVAYENLARRFGPATAERYLVWRRFQAPDRPVILLLGGATGSGKTALAVEVAHRLDIQRVLSTDSIRQVMRIMLSPELVPAIHASSYDAYRVIGPVAEGEDPVIVGFETGAKIVSVGVRAMIERAIAENTSLVIDGVSIVPGLVDFDRYRAGAHIIFLLVANLDEDAYRRRFEARAQSSRRPPHRYLENLKSILRIQDHLLELAERHDVPIVDNESRDESVLSIIKHVTGTLRKTDEFDVDQML